MAKTVETRIEQRNRMAEMYRRDQGPIARAVSGAGLAIANTWDKVTQPFKSDRTVFAGATAFGLLRGAALGLVAGMLAVAVFPPLAGAGAIFGAMAAGAVIAGVKDGQMAVERNDSAPNRPLSDQIAEKMGAIPSNEISLKGLSKELRHDLQHPEQPSELAKKANAILDKSPSFVEQEQQRRAQNGPKVLHR